MNPAILKLNEYLAELESKAVFDSIAIKAEHFGIINQVKNAIGQIELCEKFEINAGSLVNKLPETENTNFCYLVAEQNESTQPENWTEVLFKGNQVWLSGGDLVVRK
ncbi:MAG: hypothetical protein HRU38_25125 [Saccharospirillaceae bacterium]|nr:hypothetical protein [Saccharospirillaceae bacterium]